MSVVVQGLDEIIEKSATMMERAKDLSPAMEAALDYMVVSGAPDRFATETAPDGSKWRPHAKSTRQAYARERSRKRAFSFGGRSSILTKTGTLRKSVVSGPLNTSDTHSFTLGSNLPYSGVHQFGFKGSVSVPAHTRKRKKPKKKRLTGKDKAEAKRKQKEAAKRRKLDERKKKAQQSSVERAKAKAEKRKKAKARKKAKQQTSTGPIKVKAHTRKMSIPKREYLGFSDEDQLEIKDIVTNYLLTGEI